MSKIYTKTGDKGKTSLLGGKRIFKDNKIVNAYGNLDELNSFIGLLVTKDENKDLIEIQKNIFLISSYIADVEKKYITEETVNKINVSYLEKRIDALSTELPELKNFILPGGSEKASLAHICRTITRRCERNLVTLQKKEVMSEKVIEYINRLSDYFFTLARYYNYKENIKETIWTQ